jgi:hypothetical protein
MKTRFQQLTPLEHALLQTAVYAWGNGQALLHDHLTRAGGPAAELAQSEIDVRTIAVLLKAVEETPGVWLEMPIAEAARNQRRAAHPSTPSRPTWQPSR